MKQIHASLLAIGLLLSVGFAQVPNAQFKDFSGKSYDLYTLLSQGKSVYLHATASF